MAFIPIPSERTILGLHVTGTQSGAALFRGGHLIAAVAEERLSRQKRSRAFPRQAIGWCLRQAGLDDLTQVDHVVVPWNPAVHMANLNSSGFTTWRRYDPEWLYIVPNNLASLMPGMEQGGTRLGFGAREDAIIYIPHHHAHCGWSFASPFDEAAVAVIDEYGEMDSVTLGTIRGNRFDTLATIRFPYSLGVFYATFTDYLGFSANGDEWKVMGAAAYGDPSRFAGRLRAVARWTGESLWLDQTVFEFANMRFGGYSGEAMRRHLGLARRRPGDPMGGEHYDLAAACQAVFEELSAAMLGWLHARCGLDRLVLSGGCAMNSLANGRLIADTPFCEVFIGPAPADNGSCIGGPLWLLGGRARDTFRTVIPARTGPAFTDAEIRRSLEAYKIPFREPADLLGATVDRLMEGGIVGWFQGAMEFGERALGGRSILADPRDGAMKDRINASIKYREPFRPFAPSVLGHRAEEWFDLPPGQRVPYMERVFPVRAGQRDRVPAIVHADGTGRLQTVDEKDNPLYHALISRFEKRTGCPMLLNTSFNLNGEPIVCTPEDALRTFFTSGLDALAIGSFLVEKAA